MGAHRGPRRQRAGDLATSTSAILLAAGASTRMGRPKALLPWGGATLIEYQIRQLHGAGVADVIGVLGHEADQIRKHLTDDDQVVVNEAYREGRATSVRAGADALPDDADPIIVLNVDQPRPAELLRKLIEAHEGRDALVTRPVFGDQHGHPIVLAGSLLEELRQVDDASQGLLGVVNLHRDEMRDIDLRDEYVLLDLNTPEEYERAKAAFLD